MTMFSMEMQSVRMITQHNQFKRGYAEKHRENLLRPKPKMQNFEQI
jgi:hypothetical protein